MRSLSRLSNISKSILLLFVALYSFTGMFTKPNPIVPDQIALIFCFFYSQGCKTYALSHVSPEVQKMAKTELFRQRLVLFEDNIPHRSSTASVIHVANFCSNTLTIGIL